MQCNPKYVPVSRIWILLSYSLDDDYNPAYQSILSNMHVFGQCQIERSVSITSIGSFRVLQTISILGMSFQVPTMGVCFNQLSEEQSQTLRSYGLQEDPKTKFSYRGSPQPHELSAILNMHPNEQRFIPGAIPFNGYLAYTFALRAMKLFSFISQFSQRRSLPMRIPPLDSSTPAQTPYNCLEEGVKLYSASGDEEQVDLRSVIGAQNENVTVSVSQGFIASKLTTYDGIYDRSLNLESTTPRGNGLLFPYFEHMVLPDREFAANVFSRLFFKSLGDTFEACSRLWIRLRLGFRSLAITSAGQAISHAFMGIQLAENSQSTITFIIDNGIYHGFILTGEITIIHNGITHRPDTPADIAIGYAALNTRNAKLVEIVQIIQSERDMAGRPLYPVDMEELRSSYGLFRKYHDLKKGSFPEEKLGNIVKIIKEVPLGDTYLEPSAPNLIEALSYISTGSITKLEGKNIYLGNGAFTSDSRTAIALLIFGPLVPSINFGIAKDNMIVFPSPTATDANLVETEGKRAFPYFGMKLVSHQTAVNQYEKMFSSGKLFIPNGRKGKEEFTDRSKSDGIYGGTPFIDLYQKVKEIVNIKRAGTGPRKRKIGETSEEGGSRKARRMEDDNEDAMLL